MRGFGDWGLGPIPNPQSPKGSFFTFLAMTNQNYYKCIFNGVIKTAFTVLFTQIMIQVSQTIMEILKRLDLIFIIS